jgi:predicted DCC family thiol-disulfide oxidoreductase YuxK
MSLSCGARHYFRLPDLNSAWHRAFLEERPSTSLGLFRLAVAFTVGAHMIPSFFHMDDNYLSTALKTQNGWFFPLSTLQFVAASPDWLVWAFTVFFYVTLAMFALGLFSQASCILMTLACYYFYALNNFHIGTLSFDILLVTLFLMCVTNYHGDFLSLDSVWRGDAQAYRRPRPFFLQRLLQLQLAWTFWYTALSKVTAEGNWLTDNPYYYLMHYPAIGVVRDFPLREWLGQHPHMCYALGVTLLTFEVVIPFGWFIRRTRTASVILGIAFQIMLWRTLHVPTIFLFLFPALMLLFVAPERLVEWIETRRAAHATKRPGTLLYDGRCGFCLESVKRLRVLDLFGWAQLRDFHTESDLSARHLALTIERCRSEMVLIERDGRLSGGFDAFRRLCLKLPLLMALAPLVYLPGMRWLGTRVYRWIALRRYLLHRNPACSTNQCALPTATGDSSKT